MQLQNEIIAKSNGEVWMRAPVPETTSLTKVERAAKSCTACPLYKNATQTVFGEGPKRANIMMIGEQPGDYEDVAGKPLSARRAKCLIAPWRRQELIATRFT